METLYGVKRKNPLGVTVIIIVLIVFTIWTLVPIIWAGITAFKDPGDSLKPTFIPFKQFQPTLYAWERRLSHRATGPCGLSGTVSSLLPSRVQLR